MRPSGIELVVHPESLRERRVKIWDCTEDETTKREGAALRYSLGSRKIHTEEGREAPGPLSALVI
jgi:hypothetical protein